MVVLPSAKYHDASATVALTTWIQKKQEPPGVQLNRGKPQVLQAEGVKAATLPFEQRDVLEETKLSVVDGDLRGLEVPIRTSKTSRGS